MLLHAVRRRPLPPGKEVVMDLLIRLGLLNAFYMNKEMLMYLFQSIGTVSLRICAFNAMFLVVEVE